MISASVIDSSLKKKNRFEIGAIRAELEEAEDRRLLHSNFDTLHDVSIVE